jgi:hypothetical protein
VLHWPRPGESLGRDWRLGRYPREAAHWRLFHARAFNFWSQYA